MRRREFITFVGGAAAWPLTARAQLNATILHIASVWFGDPSSDTTLAGLRKGLQDLGYVEGNNIKVDAQYALGSEERLGARCLRISSRPERSTLSFHRELWLLAQSRRQQRRSLWCR